MLNDILLQTIVATVGVSIVNCEKFKFLHKMKYAIYALILSFLLCKGIPWNRENYYTYLNIAHNATNQEIQTAYRQAARVYHPDKKHESNDSSFIKLKLAYDVLTDNTRRSNYNRFGDYKNGEVDDKTATILIVLSLAQHTMFFIIGFFLSYPKKLEFSRQVFLVYNIISFCLELQFRFIEDDTSFDWIPFLGHFLPYEKILLFRMLFPLIYFISICFSVFLYTDKNSSLIFLIRSVLSTNRIIFERSNDVIESTNYLKKHGADLIAKLQQIRKHELQSTLNSRDTSTIHSKALETENENKKNLMDDASNLKLQENVEKFSLTLDSQQIELLDKCFELINHKSHKDKKVKKGSWFEFLSLQIIFGIIFFYVWLTSK